MPPQRFVERERLATCVHCGLCLASCPTYVERGTEADSPRGRIQLMTALEDGRIEPTAEIVRHLDLCLGCRACETACPSGVPYGALIEAARPFIERGRRGRLRFGRRVLAAALTSPRIARILLAPLRPFAGRPALARVPIRALAFLAAMPRRSPRAVTVEPEGSVRGTAVLLTGCVADAMFGATNRAMAALLARAGIRVVVPPGAGCCGALATHLGQHERARAQARRAAAALAATEADWVVTTAAGCGALLREYPSLLPDEPRAAEIARRTRDALELLAEIGLPPPVRPLAASVAVHDPCHLAHGQGVRAAPRALLATIPGVRLVELDEADWCCGSAGTYNLTERSMAGRLLARKLDRVQASGAEIVAAANPGCILQIRAGAIRRGSPVRVEHPIDLLAAAHDL